MGGFYAARAFLSESLRLDALSGNRTDVALAPARGRKKERLLRGRHSCAGRVRHHHQRNASKKAVPASGSQRVPDSLSNETAPMAASNGTQSCRDAAAHAFR